MPKNTSHQPYTQTTHTNTHEELIKEAFKDHTLTTVSTDATTPPANIAMVTSRNWRAYSKHAHGRRAHDR